MSIDGLNRLVEQAEQIIGSDYHFVFSEIEDRDYSNIITNVLQIRVMSEGICRYIVINDLGKDEKDIKKATLKVYLDDILRPNLLIPNEVIIALSYVQNVSNQTVHYQSGGRLSAALGQNCIVNFEFIINWFVKEYAPGVKIKDSRESIFGKRDGGIPPIVDQECRIAREKEVERLNEILLKERVAFICGFTGVGKTEFIKEYVEKYRRKKYVHIYYENDIKCLDDYILNIPMRIMGEAIKDKADIVNTKIEEIHRLKSKSLFIIDNYTGNLEDIEILIPGMDDVYNLIVVLGNCEPIDNGDKVLEIHPFDMNKSKSLFNYYCKIEYKDDEIEMLLDKIHMVPRAIKLCGLFLNSHEKMSPLDIAYKVEADRSIDSIIANLYAILTDRSFLLDKPEIRQIILFVTLLPYSGVRLSTLKEIVTMDNSEFENNFDYAWSELRELGWIVDEENDFYSINPLLSDVIFDEYDPNFTDELIFKRIKRILKPIKSKSKLIDYRDYSIDQINEIQPFIDHLYSRIKNSEKKDIALLDLFREFYTATYDMERVNEIYDIMVYEVEDNIKKLKGITKEDLIFRRGLSHFNLEDFADACEFLSEAQENLANEEHKLKKRIAKYLPYEASCKAALGYHDEAESLIKRGISLREELRDCGDDEEGGKLWISYYNYAKIEFLSGNYENAYEKINGAMNIHEKYYCDEYQKLEEKTNISSLLQLCARIQANIGMKEEAIANMLSAITIRECIKGNTVFSTGQLYCYMSEIYAIFSEWNKALVYEEKYYNVLIRQYKTEEIKKKIGYAQKKIEYFRENCNAL